MEKCYTSVTSLYPEIFVNLEEQGAPNSDNDADIFCLHYVFLPRINQSLKAFQDGWNNHKLSTENNFSSILIAYLSSSSNDDTLDNQLPRMLAMNGDDNKEFDTALYLKLILLSQMTVCKH